MESILARNLTILRNGRQTTQEQLARKLFISRSEYCRFEKGSRNPSLEHLQKLASYYGITVDSLLYELQEGDASS